jgi:type IV pilus assembly protein PilV
MLEVLIALLLFSIGVLGMIMMQSLSSANSVNSEDRAVAALLANDLMSELWSAFNPALPGTVSVPADYASWQGRVQAALRPGSQGLLAINGNVARVTITWVPQGRNNSTLNTAYANSNASFVTEAVIQ